MAIAYRSGSVSPGVVSSFTCLAVSGITDGDLRLVAHGWKPYTTEINTGGGNVITLGYSSVSRVNGTVAAAPDQGSVHAMMWWKEFVTGDANPSVSYTSTGNPSIHGNYGFYSDASAPIGVRSTGGIDGDSTGTTVAIAADDTLDAVAGDALVWAVMFTTNDNQTSITTTLPGCTLGTITTIGNSSTTAGNDGRFLVQWAPIDSGTPTGPPEFSSETTSGFSTGSAVFVVLYEESATTPVDIAGDLDIPVDLTATASVVTPVTLQGELSVDVFLEATASVEDKGVDLAGTIDVGVELEGTLALTSGSAQLAGTLDVDVDMQGSLQTVVPISGGIDIPVDMEATALLTEFILLEGSLDIPVDLSGTLSDQAINYVSAPAALAELTITVDPVVDVVAEALIEFEPIIISLYPQVGAAYVGTIYTPPVPQSVSDTDPSVATGNVLRPLYGVIADMTAPTIEDGKPI